MADHDRFVLVGRPIEEDETALAKEAESGDASDG
jgi:hypothetical protein